MSVSVLVAVYFTLVYYYYLVLFAVHFFQIEKPVPKMVQILFIDYTLQCREKWTNSSGSLNFPTFS